MYVVLYIDDIFSLGYYGREKHRDTLLFVFQLTSGKMLTTIQNIHISGSDIYIVYIYIDLYSMRILKSLIGKLFLFDSHMYVLVQDNSDTRTRTHTHSHTLSLSYTHTLLPWGLLLSVVLAFSRGYE